MSLKDLREALDGPNGTMDCYLEVRTDEEIKADIRALVGESANKRGEYAAMAMQGLCAHFGTCGETDIAETTRRAVMVADALIAELEKSK